jgi:hypothetical protein
VNIVIITGQHDQCYFYHYPIIIIVVFIIIIIIINGVMFRVGCEVDEVDMANVVRGGGTIITSRVGSIMALQLRICLVRQKQHSDRFQKQGVQTPS